MRSHRANTRRTPVQHAPLQIVRIVLLLLLFAVFTSSQLSAQTTPPQTSPTDDPGYTLHVYTNLVQVPTLVLSPQLSQLPPISRDEFNISLDGGPKFHPTQMRMEGDDPIDLAILLDVSDDAYSLLPALSRSIADFAAHSLQPHDHISIYAIDCVFIRTANDMPATDASRVANALDAAIDDPQLHRAGKPRPSCGNHLQLWGALARLAESIANAPGRRVILAVSTGHDHKSAVKWNALRRYAASRSIAIFGLYPAVTIGPARAYQSLGFEYPFNMLCQLTGGMLLISSPDSVSKHLKHFADLIRGRYILEFPRPDSDTSGTHNIDITLTKSDAFIRPAGISYPMPNPSLRSDPDTIQSAPSPAVYGTHHVLAQPQ